MKLSFSLPSKSSSQPKIIPPTNPTNTVSDADVKEYVTVFDPSKTLTNSRPRYVIPPLQNEWKPYKKMKILEVPLSSGRSDPGLQFKVESMASDLQPGADKIANGLNLRQKGKDDTFLNAVSEDMRSKPVKQVLLQSLRDDLERLPDDPGFEEFKDVSIKDFAVSLLAGYGWKERKGIWKNHKKDVKVKKYKKWNNREGLGFDVDRTKVPVSNNSEKEMKTREESLSDGKEKQKEVRKRNRPTDSYVNFREENVEQTKSSREKVRWLSSHIRVRIISKDLKGGRLYLKKGEVVDVVGPSVCDIAMDEKREIVQGVNQGLLEAALPRRGGPVLILYGRHKGVYGSLVEKDLDIEKAVVRDANNHELFTVKLDQIAEYVGIQALLDTDSAYSSPFDSLSGIRIATKWSRLIKAAGRHQLCYIQHDHLP